MWLLTCAVFFSFLAPCACHLWFVRVYSAGERFEVVLNHEQRQLNQPFQSLQIYFPNGSLLLSYNYLEVLRVVEMWPTTSKKISYNLLTEHLILNDLTSEEEGAYGYRMRRGYRSLRVDDISGFVFLAYGVTDMHSLIHMPQHIYVTPTNFYNPANVAMAALCTQDLVLPQKGLVFPFACSTLPGSVPLFCIEESCRSLHKNSAAPLLGRMKRGVTLLSTENYVNNRTLGAWMRKSADYELYTHSYMRYRGKVQITRQVDKGACIQLKMVETRLKLLPVGRTVTIARALITLPC
ncbi:ORF132 [Ranid herpesvirus 2]|uniref:ORF132 n=1 Tax=Ranid herpesvirus 2 TaxID=389214 RepID=Q14VX4_9VIRU|nr:ORF132 [Ranid herpesvirus 2]ABG25652.1 ORF132 [Ranid herpesvirus 2]